MDNYIFTSKRLGFRNWKISEVYLLYEINSNKDAMQFFPSTQTRKQTEEFIIRMLDLFEEKGFCYFAVDILKTKECIGFVGLSLQNFESDFTPAIDIGWRLHPKFWNKGFATEGAKRCLEYGFKELNLKKIIAVAPKINIPSIAVMEKIGMKKVKDFQHPLLLDFLELRDSVLFDIKSLQTKF